MHFFDFDIIRQPPLPALAQEVDKTDAELLVIYKGGEERTAFLLNVLKAASYTVPEKELMLWELADESPALDLSALLLRQSKTAPKLKKVMIFGIAPKALGLHFNVGRYVPVEVNQYTYLLADDLMTIRDEKAAGSTQKAGALWRSVKAAFLKHTS